jgi:hypothetical protein
VKRVSFRRLETCAAKEVLITEMISAIAKDINLGGTPAEKVALWR